MNRTLSLLLLLLCLMLPGGFTACSDDETDDATLIYEKITSTYHDYLMVFVEDELIAYGTPDIAKGYEAPWLVIEAQGKTHYLNLNYLRTMTLGERDEGASGNYAMRLYFSDRAYRQSQP